jgi:hypothetical protein
MGAFYRSYTTALVMNIPFQVREYQLRNIVWSYYLVIWIQSYDSELQRQCCKKTYNATNSLVCLKNIIGTTTPVL